jgi:hypothetical protein
LKAEPHSVQFVETVSFALTFMDGRELVLFCIDRSLMFGGSGVIYRDVRILEITGLNRANKSQLGSSV